MALSKEGDIKSTNGLRTWTAEEWQREQGGPTLVIQGAEGRTFRGAYGSPAELDEQLDIIRIGNAIADLALERSSQE